MDNNYKSFIKDYLSNLNVTINIAGYQKVWPDWEDMDYTPNYNKFYLICDGEGYIKIGDKEYYPKAGQFVLMPSGLKQSYSVINENTYTKYWCHFTAKVGEMNLFDVMTLPFIIEVKDFSVPEQLFKELLENYFSNETTSAIRLKGKLLELIAYFIENAVVERIKLMPSDNIEKLNMVLNYIESNLSKNITVEDLASMLHLHPNYFIRIFKKYLGTTPINYLIKKRIDAAKMLISSTEDTLSVIAGKIGIDDIYYLSRLFKEYTGFTPSEFRKMSHKI